MRVRNANSRRRGSVRYFTCELFTKGRPPLTAPHSLDWIRLCVVLRDFRQREPLVTIEIHACEGDEIIDLADSVCSLSCARKLMEKWENSYEL